MYDDLPTYNFVNNAHIGDCLISLHFLKKLAQKNNVVCQFSCDLQYMGNSVNQLLEFVSDEPRIRILSQPVENSINLWYPVILQRIENSGKEPYPFYKYGEDVWHGDIFKIWYHIGNQVAQELRLKPAFDNVEEVIFDGELFRRDTLLNGVDGQPQKFDFLIINSYCMSGQVKFTPQQQDQFFDFLIQFIIQNNKTFITTQKLRDYPCTTDYNLSLVQLAQIAKNCKVIIGVPTSPYLIAINDQSYKNCEFINISHDYLFFDLNNKFHNYSPDLHFSEFGQKISDLIK
jgi:hypothetical protein